MAAKNGQYWPTELSCRRTGPTSTPWAMGRRRWFRRNRRAGWASSGSAAPPKSLEIRRIRCRREQWTRRPPRPVLSSSAIAVRGGIIGYLCVGVSMMLMLAAMDARSGFPGVAIHGRMYHQTPLPSRSETEPSQLSLASQRHARKRNRHLP